MIKEGDIVRSVSGGYGPVEEIRIIDGITYYWVNFRYGYRLTHEGSNHRNWTTSVTVIQPGIASVTKTCVNCQADMSHFRSQAMTCSPRCRKAYSRKMKVGEK